MPSFDLSIFSDGDTWVALATLTLMEIVLGIDNVIFISILSGRLPPEQQGKARTIGLSLALVMRLGLLFAITWVMGLTSPLFSIAGQAVSGRDLILGLGGLFLIAKSTHEIYNKLEVEDDDDAARMGASPSLVIIIIEILLLDIVFSLDSVITAIGMAQHIEIMIIAMVVAVGVMLIFAGRIGRFINDHPSMKVLALSFLLLIGVMLVAESLDQHIDKGYIYFAMAFSLLVELVNMRLGRRRRKPVVLHEHVP
jgi:predicted tellurium resistance membrane protein TerC